MQMQYHQHISAPAAGPGLVHLSPIDTGGPYHHPLSQPRLLQQNSGAASAGGVVVGISTGTIGGGGGGGGGGGSSDGSDDVSPHNQQQTASHVPHAHAVPAGMNLELPGQMMGVGGLDSGVPTPAVESTTGGGAVIVAPRHALPSPLAAVLQRYN
jgi:hypothetical protein